MIGGSFGMEQVCSAAKVQLDGNADAVEFCPKKSFAHILAAASYTLREASEHEGEASRIGSLNLFSVKHNSGVGLTKVHQNQAPGIFDIKWRPSQGDDDGPAYLAEAGADGGLRLNRLTEGQQTSSVKLAQVVDLHIRDSMCLYVDWEPLESHSQVVVSHADGSVSVVDFGQSEPHVHESWKAHDFEGWVVAYDSTNHRVVYSGGDDSQYCGWDLREARSRPIFRDKRTHSMGVCSIQSSPLRNNVVITGSYDEKIRLWDMRMMQRPVNTKALGLGGGVWRLKWHHSDRELFVAACMHNGAAIGRARDDGIYIVKWYKEHASLTYGASWFQGEPGLLQGEGYLGAQSGGNFERADFNGDRGKDSHPEGSDVGMNTLVATCSFYDKALHLWRP